MKSVELTDGKFRLHKVLSITADEHGALQEPTTETDIFTDTADGAVLYISDDDSALYVKLADGTLKRIDAKVDVRTAAIPGATPDQILRPHFSSPVDKDVLYSYTDSNGVKRLKLAYGDGSNNVDIAIGFGVGSDTDEDTDLEWTDADNVFGLGAGHKFSVITGDSDAVGANGQPIRQGGQPAGAGANPAPLKISGGGDAPLGQLLGKKTYILIPKLSSTVADGTEHQTTAYKGEILGDSLSKLLRLAENNAGEDTGSTTAVSSGTNGYTEMANTSASLYSVGDLINCSTSMGGTLMVASLGIDKILVNASFASFDTPFDTLKRSRATVVGGGQVIEESNTSRLVSLGDDHAYIRFNSATDDIVSLGNLLTTQYPIGYAVEAANIGSGTVSINTGANVTTNNLTGLSAFKMLRAVHVKPDEWDIVGS